jgi:hypothetical protein
VSALLFPEEPVDRIHKRLHRHCLQGDQFVVSQDRPFVIDLDAWVDESTAHKEQQELGLHGAIASVQDIFDPSH